MKTRLDVLLVARGLAESREKAQRVIMAGQVRIKDQVVTKAGHRYDDDVEIDLKALPRFVSRGGEKLDAAMSALDLDVTGLVCLDVGASTGGFTDCLLQRGAAEVYAIDVGKGQIHDRLRRDARVTVREKVNARYLEPGDFPVRFAFATADVSFISLKLVLPAVVPLLNDGAKMVTLIKPQFEAGRDEVGKGGVVRDQEIRDRVVAEIRQFGTETLGLQCVGVLESPLRGPAGNVEYLAVWVKTE